MPSSAVRTFADPDAYFAGIRNLQVVGLVTRRGDFRAESTHIDLHRLWMYRSDESLPPIMKITPSGMRALILFATDPDQPATAPTAFPHRIGAPTPALSRLLKLHDAAGRLAKTAPDILAKPEVARAVEQALMEAMVLCLAGGHSEDLRNV